MQRATRQRLGWAVAVLVLLALAAWQWRSDANAEPGSVLDLAPEQVTRIALGIGGAPALHYEKRDGQWWQTDGTPRRADDGRLAELAATAAAPVLAWRAAADFDPARIGLAPPQAVLSLDGHTLSSAPPPPPARSATYASASASPCCPSVTVRARPPARCATSTADADLGTTDP
jgi:hypothetical protein